MRSLRFAALGLLIALATHPLPAENEAECLSLSVAQDTDISSPTGIRVTINGRNNCSRDLNGSRCRFKVTAIGSGGGEIATHYGRFGGTIAAQSRTETKLFVVCDPERVRSFRVEAQ